jgi:hypothetical protein
MAAVNHAPRPSVINLEDPEFLMSDHHFSYPKVVPVGAMTISGHSTNEAPASPTTAGGAAGR